ALKLRLHDSKLLNNLGFLYIEKREFDKAGAVLQRAEKLSRGRDSAVYANFGLLYELQGKRPEALEAYRKAKALAPTNEMYAQKVEGLEKKLAADASGNTSSAATVQE